MVQIDKNIPIPAEDLRAVTTPYPWLEMEIGDSFLFRTNDLGNARLMCRRHSTDGRVFDYRRVSKTSIRCWRTA
jgi:hypothetical protein